MSNKLNFFPFVYMCILLLGMNVHAQDVKRILLGSQPKSFQNVTPPFYFRTRSTDIQSSLCCTILGNSVDADVTEVTGFDLTNQFQDFTYRGGTSPVISSHKEHPLASSEKSRICMMDISGATIAKVEISPETPAETFDEVEVSCEDTTLIGGFNTVVTEFNFLEIINASAAPVNARLYGYRETTDGEEVIDLSFVIPGDGSQRRRDIGIHDFTGTGTFGTLVLTHDAPKDSLRASIAHYKAKPDSTFEFVSRSALTQR